MQTHPSTPVTGSIRLMVLDPHPIFRIGLAVCLSRLDSVSEVIEVGSVEEAFEDRAIEAVDIVVVDPDLAGGLDAVRRLHAATTAGIVVCSFRGQEADVLAGVQAGAIGYLAKGTLTPQMLAAAVNATANGGGVVAPELLAPLLHGIARVAREQLEPRGLSLSLLTKREQRVLQLLAEGQSTHEVAVTLSYSERTVKNILHDVVIKFNARTRSQAVAYAVRAGLI